MLDNVSTPTRGWAQPRLLIKSYGVAHYGAARRFRVMMLYTVPIVEGTSQLKAIGVHLTRLPWSLFKLFNAFGI